MRKTIILLIAVVLVLAACGDDDTVTTNAGEPTTTTAGVDDPVSSDDPTTTTTVPPNRTEPGPAYVDSVEILLMESWPVQVAAAVKGTLPNPCHTLTWDVSEMYPDGRFTVTIGSLFDPAEACIERIEQFEVSIPIADLTSGDYVVMVNGVDYPFSI